MPRKKNLIYLSNNDHTPLTLQYSIKQPDTAEGKTCPTCHVLQTRNSSRRFLSATGKNGRMDAVVHPLSFMPGVINEHDAWIYIFSWLLIDLDALLAPIRLVLPPPISSAVAVGASQPWPTTWQLIPVGRLQVEPNWVIGRWLGWDEDKWVC